MLVLTDNFELGAISQDFPLGLERIHFQSPEAKN
jgi:hypothetical protein